MTDDGHAQEMTSEDVMRIACRAVAVFYIASLLSTIAERLSWLSFQDSSERDVAGAVLSLLISIAAMIALPVVVWKLAPTLARLSEGHGSRVRIPSGLTDASVMRLVIATVGVIFLALGLADLVYALGDFMALTMYEKSDPMAGGVARATLTRDAITGAGECVIGLAFMLGSRLLLRLVGRVRRIGLEPGAGSPEDRRPDDTNPG